MLENYLATILIEFSPTPFGQEGLPKPRFQNQLREQLVRFVKDSKRRHVSVADGKESVREFLDKNQKRGGA